MRNPRLHLRQRLSSTLANPFPRLRSYRTPNRLIKAFGSLTKSRISSTYRHATTSSHNNHNLKNLNHNNLIPNSSDLNLPIRRTLSGTVAPPLRRPRNLNNSSNSNNSINSSSNTNNSSSASNSNRSPRSELALPIPSPKLLHCSQLLPDPQPPSAQRPLPPPLHQP